MVENVAVMVLPGFIEAALAPKICWLSFAPFS